MLFEETVTNLSRYEFYFFSGNIEKLRERNDFIDTGDGGFLILDNPIQALIFSVYFEKNLNRFNSFKLNSTLREVLGIVKTRFSLSTDKLIYIKELNNY
ncbi:MAG: hypothetical protein GW938_17725 [Leptospira sp.]|nr:hypothetical protein [Leptospira sp.]